MYFAGKRPIWKNSSSLKTSLWYKPSVGFTSIQFFYFIFWLKFYRVCMKLFSVFNPGKWNLIQEILVFLYPIESFSRFLKIGSPYVSSLMPLHIIICCQRVIGRKIEYFYFIFLILLFLYLYLYHISSLYLSRFYIYPL